MSSSMMSGLLMRSFRSVSSRRLLSSKLKICGPGVHILTWIISGLCRLKQHPRIHWLFQLNVPLYSLFCYDVMLCCIRWDTHTLDSALPWSGRPQTAWHSFLPSHTLLSSHPPIQSVLSLCLLEKRIEAIR